MLAADKLYTKVVNNEGKCDGVPAVGQEAWGSRCLLVSVFVETRCKEIVGQFASLFEAVYLFLDLEVYPAIAGQGSEVIFVCEFPWDDGELYLDVFMPV